MLYFKFLLNTDEETKRKQISDHMFHHTATTRRLIGYYYEPGLYFRKNQKLIYGFYHPFSTKLTFQNARKSQWVRNTYFGGQIVTKADQPYYRGFIFTNLFHYAVLIMLLYILFKMPLHPFPWIALLVNVTVLVFHQYRCHKELKSFFTEYSGEEESEG